MVNSGRGDLFLNADGVDNAGMLGLSSLNVNSRMQFVWDPGDYCVESGSFYRKEKYFLLRIPRAC